MTFYIWCCKMFKIVLFLSLVALCSGQASISLVETVYTVLEGEQVIVLLQKSGTAASDINIVVEIQNPSEHGIQDFVSISQATVISAGTESFVTSLQLTANDDLIPERDEIFHFTVRVTNGHGIMGQPSSGRIIIAANDFGFGIFGFVNSKTTMAEELPGQNNSVSLMVERTRGTFEDITLSYQVISLSGDTETGNERRAEADISPIIGNLTFYEGETRKPLMLYIIEDEVSEQEETFMVILINVNRGDSVIETGNGPVINASHQRANITIYANDAPVRIAMPEYHTEERDYQTMIQVIVTRGLDSSGKTIGPVHTSASALYYTESVSAESGLDYILNNGSVNFAPGATNAAINIEILKDEFPEAMEYFKIVLYEGSGDVVIQEQSIALVMINANDDANGVLSFKPNNLNQASYVYVNEDSSTVGANMATFVVTRNGGSFGEIEIDWSVAHTSNTNSTNAMDILQSDVQPLLGTLVFRDGNLEQSIHLEITKDEVPEPVRLYLVHLIPESIRGGGRVEGLVSAHLVIQDSDNAFGTIQFTDKSAQAIKTDSSPRRLSLTLQRLGGVHGNIKVLYMVQYADVTNHSQVIFVSGFPTTTTIVEGSTGHTFEVFLHDEAFLTVGSYFTAQILQLIVDGNIVTYNSPSLGARQSVNVDVTSEVANGQVGFVSVQPVIVDEPKDTVGTHVISIPVERIGTNGFVAIHWTVSGAGPMADHVTSDDIQPLSGTLTMVSGQWMGDIALEILPDDLPETEEILELSLTSVDPDTSQRFITGATVVNIIIPENDRPGGIFQFSSEMSLSYIVEEELSPVSVSIVRTDGALVKRQVEYYIDSLNAQAEFYGARNMLTFLPGEVEKTATLLARGDGVPELTETFHLRLRSHGDKFAEIGSKSSINITVLENEYPYGIFAFPNNSVFHVDESKVNSTITAQIPVLRTRGRFGTTTVTWTIIENSAGDDLYPLNGTLEFGPGEGQKVIEIETLVDELPELEEHFTLFLLNATNGATVVDNEDSHTTLVINKNDDAVYFKEYSVGKIEEGSTVELTITRDGTTDSRVSVKYRTLNGESIKGLDFKPVENQLVEFDVGERSKVVEIVTFQDEDPETDERFYVELYDAQGDIAVYKTPRAEVIIAANDDANGAFGFNLNEMIKKVQEGSVANFEIMRSGGHHSEVVVYWQIFSNDTKIALPAGEDFEYTEGNVTFSDMQTVGSAELIVITDGIPEYAEEFILVLVNVSGGGPSGQMPHLSMDNIELHFRVSQNDEPFGLFSFALGTREVSIAEDYSVDEDSGIAVLTVERQMGSYGQVKVSWEVFSYQIAGGVHLPRFIDILCVGSPGEGMLEQPLSQRPQTNAIVYKFDGCQDCYLKVDAINQLGVQNMEDGFSITFWIQPNKPATGYVLAKTSNTNRDQHYYSVRLVTSSDGSFRARIQFRYSTPDNAAVNLVQSELVLFNWDEWNHVVISIFQGEAHFYLNGENIGLSTLIAYGIEDGLGDLYIGTLRPGETAYTGLLQDLRLFERHLQTGEIEELHTTPSTKDLKVISGYLVFEEGEVTKEIHIESIDDLEEEANDVFAVKLLSANRGAKIAEQDSTAILTVLKSDNANGLFGFSRACIPQDSTTDHGENVTFICSLERGRGDTDTVVLSWEIHQISTTTELGTGNLAEKDFVNASGTVKFLPGEREQKHKNTVCMTSLITGYSLDWTGRSEHRGTNLLFKCSFVMA